MLSYKSSLVLHLAIFLRGFDLRGVSWLIFCETIRLRKWWCRPMMKFVSLKQQFSQSIQLFQTVGGPWMDWSCDWKNLETNLCRIFFSMDGRMTITSPICFCFRPTERTFHDSTMANMSTIYDLIDNLYERMGSKIVVDSAFSKIVFCMRREVIQGLSSRWSYCFLNIKKYTYSQYRIIVY